MPRSSRRALRACSSITRASASRRQSARYAVRLRWPAGDPRLSSFLAAARRTLAVLDQMNGSLTLSFKHPSRAPRSRSTCLLLTFSLPVWRVVGLLSRRQGPSPQREQLVLCADPVGATMERSNWSPIGRQPPETPRTTRIPAWTNHSGSRGLCSSWFCSDCSCGSLLISGSEVRVLHGPPLFQGVAGREGVTRPSSSPHFLRVLDSRHSNGGPVLATAVCWRAYEGKFTASSARSPSRLPL
jgi:hypothetical protein